LRQHNAAEIFLGWQKANAHSFVYRLLRRVLGTVSSAEVDQLSGIGGSAKIAKGVAAVPNFKGLNCRLPQNLRRPSALAALDPSDFQEGAARYGILVTVAKPTPTCC